MDAGSRLRRVCVLRRRRPQVEHLESGAVVGHVREGRRRLPRRRRRCLASGIYPPVAPPPPTGTIVERVDFSTPSPYGYTWGIQAGSAGSTDPAHVGTVLNAATDPGGSGKLVGHCSLPSSSGGRAAEGLIKRTIDLGVTDYYGVSVWVPSGWHLACPPVGGWAATNDTTFVTSGTPLQLLNNALTTSNPGFGSGFGYWTPTTFTDCECWTPGIASLSNLLRLYVRLNPILGGPGTTNGYALRVSGTTYLITKVTNAAETTIASSSDFGSQARPCMLRAVGSRISACVYMGTGWEEVAAVSDSSYTSGYLGFQSPSPGSNTISGFGGGSSNGSTPGFNATAIIGVGA